MLTDAEDLKLFPNLRYVSILSSYDVYNIEYNATLYSYYNQYYGGDSFDAESIISALSLSDINNLQAFSSNPRIEYLSLANSSVNSLNGIASLPSLKFGTVRYIFGRLRRCTGGTLPHRHGR